MATITVTIDDEKVRQTLKSLGDRAKDLTPAMKQIGEYLRFRTEENFKKEQSPDRQKWAPLNKDYAQAKEKRKGIRKILQFTGDLRSTIAYQAEKRQVTIGTNKKVGSYSLGAIHQLGAPRKNIPPRPFLGLSDADRSEVILIISDYLNTLA
jgi:phage virion morphogenesis protein